MSSEADCNIREDVPLLHKQGSQQTWSRTSFPLVMFFIFILICCMPGLPGQSVFFLVGNRWFPPVHPSCALPPQMRWCRTRPGFHLACLQTDIVCKNICTWGFWERPSIHSFGFPKAPVGDIVDIGANVGWYSFLFAQAGYTVHAFEALPSNVQLLNASICANPGLKGQLQIHPVALGAASVGSCKVYSSINNIGNGSLCCPDHPCPYENHPMYEVRQDRLMTTTLDAELNQLATPIGFIKLDVEGYECEVVKGAHEVLNRSRPQYMVSEIWQDEVGCGASGYLSLLRSSGYAVSLLSSGAGFLAPNFDTARAEDVEHITDVLAVRRGL